MQLPPADTRHTLTRAQVAAHLGVSTSSVRRLEWDKLHPTQDERGVWRFDPGEVDAVATEHARRPAELKHATEDRAASSLDARRGRLAARVFLMFGRHRSLPEIVVVTKQPPEVIRKLYREWSTTLDDGEWERRQRDA